MAGTRTADIDDGVDLDVNITSGSPHVIAYILWTRRPGDADWTEVARGNTSDNVSDHHIIKAPLPKGSRLTYWLGMGDGPGTKCRGIVTLAQNGKVVPDGLCIEDGKTDSNGVYVVETEVTLQ